MINPEFERIAAEWNCSLAYARDIYNGRRQAGRDSPADRRPAGRPRRTTKPAMREALEEYLTREMKPWRRTELAEKFGVSENTIRRHLKDMEANMLAALESETQEA